MRWCRKMRDFARTFVRRRSPVFACIGVTIGVGIARGQRLYVSAVVGVVARSMRNDFEDHGSPYREIQAHPQEPNSSALPSFSVWHRSSLSTAGCGQTVVHRHHGVVSPTGNGPKKLGWGSYSTAL